MTGPPYDLTEAPGRKKLLRAGRLVAMAQQFVSEALTPVVATSDTERMAIGEPGLPREFRWRNATIEIESVLRSWHDTGDCRNGSGEQYVRKHWYEVTTRSDGVMKIYFDRQPRGGAKAPRWWLFSIDKS